MYALTEYYLFWGVLTSIFVLLLPRLTKYYNFKRKVNKLPGPVGYPIFGHLFEVWNHKATDVLPSTVEHWNMFAKKGLYRFNVLRRSHVQLCKPEYVQTLLSSNEQINKTSDYIQMMPWLGNGIIHKTGKEWQSRRKLLTPTFHFKILEDFYDSINDHADILVNTLSKEVGKKSFSMFPYLSYATLDIICEVAMGYKMTELGQTIHEYLEATKIVMQLGQRRTVRPWTKTDWLYYLTKEGKMQKRYVEKLHAFTNKVIEARKKQRSSQKNEHKVTKEDFGEKKRLAFLDLILELSEDGKSLTNQQLQEEVDTMMFAGHDTTATALTWTLYLLGRNPDIQKKARQEIRDVIGKNRKLKVTSEHLQELKYLERVIKESLRLYPPVPMYARDLTEDMKFGDNLVPAGTVIILTPYLLHRNPDSFPDPEKFEPDRFLPEVSHKRHPYALIPFSAGPRNCLGQKFALMEIKIVLAHLLNAYNFEAIEAPQDLKLIVAVMLSTENGVLMKINKL